MGQIHIRKVLMGQIHIRKVLMGQIHIRKILIGQRADDILQCHFFFTCGKYFSYLSAKTYDRGTHEKHLTLNPCHAE